MVDAKFDSILNNLIPQHDFMRITSPTIGFPTIQFPNNTFTIEVCANPGLSTHISNWAAQIHRGHRKILVDGKTIYDYGNKYYYIKPLQILEINYPSDHIYRITVKIPDNTAVGLYDLKLIVGRESLTQENSIQVLHKFNPEPTLCVLADLHVGFEGYPCIDEPSVDEKALIINAIKEINRLHPDLVFLLGDLVDWSSTNNWKDFTSLIKSFEVPAFTIVGNHDFYWDNWWTGYPPLLPAPTRSDPLSLRYYLRYINPFLRYSFNYGKLHICCLNSGEDAVLAPFEAFGAGLSNEDIDWTKKDLKDHELNLIFMHHPVTRAGSKDITKSDKHIGCITQNRQNFMELCSHNNVTAVFSGHEHIMEHWHENNVDYYTVPSITRSHEDNAFVMIYAKAGKVYQIDSYNENLTNNKQSPVNVTVSIDNTPVRSCT